MSSAALTPRTVAAERVTRVRDQSRAKAINRDTGKPELELLEVHLVQIYVSLLDVWWRKKHKGKAKVHKTDYFQG